MLALQLILSGDFHQLPPVGKGKEGAAARRFCFEGEAWGRCIADCCILSKVFRQVGSWLGCQLVMALRHGAALR